MIEPRKFHFVGVDALIGAEDHTDVPSGLARRSHRGRRAGHVLEGCPGTWEASRLCFEHRVGPAETRTRLTERQSRAPSARANKPREAVPRAEKYEAGGWDGRSRIAP